MTKKEIDKFLANTKVYVNGKSKEIQEKLFSLGYKWSDGDVNVCHTKAPFLFIYENMIFTKNSDMEYFSSHGNREISAEEILSLELTEPKYRPFTDKEECWNEMLKHQPFGWIRNKVNRAMVHISFALGGYVMLATENRGFSDVFDKFEFIDGTPFGIKEE